MPAESRLRHAVIGETEGAPEVAEAERLERALAVPVSRWLRADAAFFLAGDCTACRRFHVDRRLYDVEAAEDGEPLVTARFAARCPAVRYRIGGRLEPPGCAAEPRAHRIAWP
jgi:hypothetical protein